MSELSATAANVPTASRAGSRGAVIVGDYLGAPAAQAARAVRRVGLRPGLDRQFGGDPQTVGLVVAQEPDAGSEAPRGAMITLYVSAPAASVQGLEEDASVGAPMHGGDPQVPPSPSGAVAASSAGGVRRKRRERPTAPAPARSDEAPQRIDADVPPRPSVFAGPEREQTGRDQAAGTFGEEDLACDPMTLAMRDVFKPDAGGFRDRSIYPRRPVSLRMRGAWVRLKTHWAVATVACMLLALCVSVAVTRPQNTATQPTDARASSPQPANAARPDSALAPPSATRSDPHRKGSREVDRRARRAPHPAAGSAAPRRLTAHQNSPQSSLGVPESPRPSAASVPAASQTQTGGGPFSP